MNFPIVAAALLATAPSDEEGTHDQAKQVFEDGQAQVVEAFSERREWLRDELWVEAEFDSDGDGRKDRMHVDVTRPRQTDSEGLKVAVLYHTSPYFAGVAGGGLQYFWDPHQELDGKPKPRDHAPAIKFDAKRKHISESLVGEWVPRGFAVVHSESPGTGLSQGSPSCGGPNESLAPKAVIDWLNGRAKGFTKVEGGEEVKAYWSTGRVGMTGTSYDGTLCLAAATTGVEGLDAIVPIAPNTSYYRYYRSNGLVRHPGGWTGEDMDVLFEFIHSGDPSRREWAQKHVRDDELVKGMDRKTGDWNDFWEKRDYWLQLDGVKAATLLAHGLNDWNVMPEHSIHVFAALKAQGVPTQLYLHQGAHGGDPPFEWMNRWFSRWLCDVENGVEDEPLCRVVREGASPVAPTAYPDYPNPAASGVLLRPAGGGRGLGKLALDGDVAEKAPATETLVDDVEVPGAELAKAKESPHRLLYALPPLAAPLHLSGTAKVKVRVAADRDAANLSVWIVSLPWAGGRDLNADLITRGWADPRNHASLSQQEPLVPGKAVDVAFDLQPDDQVIPAGEQIALLLFSSDRDFTLWPKAGTKLTVELAETWLELPVVGGAEALAKALGAAR